MKGASSMNDILLCGAAMAFIIAFFWGSFDSDNDGESNMKEYLTSMDTDKDNETSATEVANFAVVPVAFLGLSTLVSYTIFVSVGALIFVIRATREATWSARALKVLEKYAPQDDPAMQHFVDQEASGHPSVVDLSALQAPSLERSGSHASSTQPTLSRARSFASKKSSKTAPDDDKDLPLARRRNTRFLSQVTQALLQNIDFSDTLKDEMEDWDYDVFDLEAKVANPLVAVGMTCLESISSITVDHAKMRNFLNCIEAEYKSVPYHNHLHGAAVARSAFSMCKELGLGAKLNDKVQFALVLAGLIHDVGHPGLTAPYLCKVGHELALTYSDESPLERMHLATAFKIMRKEENVFLGNEDFICLKRPIVQAVLGTDMSLHHQQMVRLQALTTNLKSTSKDIQQKWYFPPTKNFPKDGKEARALEQDEQAWFVMALYLHAADIASPTMPYNQFRRWNELVQKEFHAQGDLEKETFGEIISTKEGYDRNESNLAVMKFTLGFISFLVLPLFTELDALSKIDVEDNFSREVKLKVCLDNAENNKKELNDAIAKHEGGAAPAAPIA